MPTSKRDKYTAPYRVKTTVDAERCGQEGYDCPDHVDTGSPMWAAWLAGSSQSALKSSLEMADRFAQLAALNLANADARSDRLRAALSDVLTCALCDGRGDTKVKTATGEMSADYDDDDPDVQWYSCPCRYNARKALAA